MVQLSQQTERIYNKQVTMSEIASNDITNEDFEKIMEELCVSLKRMQKITYETALLVDKINKL